MLTLFKLLGIAVAAILGILVFVYVVVPIAGFCLSVLWALAAIFAFIAKVCIFVGLLFLAALILLRLVAKGLELILY